MRTLAQLGLALAALALAPASALAKPPAKPAPPAAPSAEHVGVPASYRTRLGHGYSERGRRMLDCLASDHRYDPSLDRIRVRPGVTRRCGP